MKATITTAVRGGPGAPSAEPAAPLLDPTDPGVLLGGADPLVGSVAPTPESLYGPRGACLLGADGPLWVADTGHHRLLGWKTVPREDGVPADWVLGQPGFEEEGRNANRTPSPETLNVPTGVSRFGERGLMVADGWNNRVLIWFEAPTASHVPADVVLGQPDFSGELPNHGTMNVAGPDTMHWPFAAIVHDGRLYVADTGNRRVLVWQTLPRPGDSGRPADYAIGQPDLVSRSDNGGLVDGADATSMRWPHDLVVWNGRLAVADAGDNRVQSFALPVERPLPAAAHLLGQPDAHAVDHNQSGYWPDAHTLNMPYCAAATPSGWLLVGDTANSRILGFAPDVAASGRAAVLAGQPHFRMKGDNGWGDISRDSLCWPYGLHTEGDVVIVADTGNHRVKLARLAPQLRGEGS